VAAASAAAIANNNWTQVNATAWASRIDAMLDTLAASGVHVALGIGLHEMSVQMPADALVALARYTAARYGAYPITWITAQEVNAPNANVTAWGLAAAALEAGDGYRHPLTAHMWVNEYANFTGEPYTYGDEPWHSWFATQGGHTGEGVRPQSHYQSYWNWSTAGGSVVPFLEAEAMYEGVICGPRYAGANDTRAAAWKSMLCGSFGYTYGGAAVWLFRWDLNDTTGEQYNPNTWWWPGSQLPASAQMQHLRALFEDELGMATYAALQPRFGAPAWCGFADGERTVLASTDDAATVVVYSYVDGDYAEAAAAGAGGGRALGTVRGLAVGSAGGYTARWYDPREGTYTAAAAGPVQPGDDGSWLVPTTPDAQDWVLLLQLNA